MKVRTQIVEALMEKAPPARFRVGKQLRYSGGKPIQVFDPKSLDPNSTTLTRSTRKMLNGETAVVKKLSPQRGGWAALMKADQGGDLFFVHEYGASSWEVA